MKFDKCHGLGNDYIYVDAAHMSLVDAQAAAPDLCPRGPGIGADGIILLGQLDSGHVSMRMVNADGSEGLICGNGLRCVAHLAKRWGWVDGMKVIVDTAVGERQVLLQSYSPEESQVCVAMGMPDFSAELVTIEGKDLKVTTNIADVMLYPDQAVPLSLLVAEAATNAMKYIGEQASWCLVREHPAKILDGPLQP